MLSALCSRNLTIDTFSGSGVIVGGLDQGLMTMYDAGKVIAGQTEGALVFSKNKHTGPVQALDFNPFQKNLLASGASESGMQFNRHFSWPSIRPRTFPKSFLEF